MLQAAIEAARAAGRIQREHFGSVLEVDREERRDIKLRVDKLCEEAIVQTIHARYPDHAILAEERGAQGESRYRWIIDPLDGTMNFFYGIPHFCSSVGLEVDGRPELGAVYDPLREELFTASRGEGAYLNDRRIRVSPIQDPAEAVVVVGFMKSEETLRQGLAAFSAALRRVRKLRSTGSASLDLAYVAAGRFTAYYEVGIHSWDVAAGRALLSEAGGRFEACQVSPDTLNVYASNGLVHNALADVFRIDF